MNIHSVAKDLKISVATVSRALNPATRHLVAEKTRKKIEDFVRAVGYVPNRTARELSTGKTKTIGLVCPNVLPSIFFNDYLIKLLAGLYNVLDADSGYNCKIMILPRGQVLSQLERQVHSSGIDGLLLSPYCDPALYGGSFPKDLLSGWHRPVVLLNLQVKGLKRFSSVYVDHTEAAYKGVTYLIQKGHRDIAFVRGSDDFPEAVQRYEGYEKALADHGLKTRKEWVVEGNFLMEGGYAAALQLMRKGAAKPSAVFCANDETAIGVIQALKTLRVRCPADLAVMGFDGLEIGQYIDPKLTSVAQPTAQVAEIATRLLLELIQNPKKEPVLRAVSSALLLRESA
jgi:LacI family transcriptional regulator